MKNCTNEQNRLKRGWGLWFQWYGLSRKTPVCGHLTLPREEGLQEEAQKVGFVLILAFKRKKGEEVELTVRPNQLPTVTYKNKLGGYPNLS